MQTSPVAGVSRFSTDSSRCRDGGGPGPWLMLLGGGASDADGLDRIACRLTADYTVITHDRRGLSRSLLDDPASRRTSRSRRTARMCTTS